MRENCHQNYRRDNLKPRYNRATASKVTDNSLLLQVEVIPFAVDDCQHGPLEDASGNTVYVGGLHGTMRARHVADVFAELFGAVTSVTLYVDRYNYPKGKHVFR